LFTHLNRQDNSTESNEEKEERLDRIYGMFRIFCFVHFEFPEEIQNTKSLREGGSHPVNPVDPV